MKKLALAFVCVLMVGLFSNCGGGNDPQGANLFIEKPLNAINDNYEFNIKEVICQVAYEASKNEENILEKNLGTVTINGYDYFMFRVPKNRRIVSLVIQSYYFRADGHGTEDGERETHVQIDLKKYDWAKLNIVERTDPDGSTTYHNGYVYEVEQGNGPVR